MKYYEFKEMCRGAYSEKFNFLCIDMSKDRNEDKYRFFDENKNTFIECICESEPFRLSYLLFAIDNREGIEKLEELA